ncbi:MAG: SulP family inorganic anion transporter, partial [Bacteroidia bacterium]|nr:SulP family inorganic anion transporter [Bacteroidia bacterium]
MKSLFRNLGSDVPASIVVFLVALPLCLGIAIGSDAPPISGIIAGIIGGIVVGFISSSSLSVSGPAAGLIATVSLAITQLTAALRDSGMPESELSHAAFSGLLVAIIIAGVLQLLLGILKSGIIVSFVPVAVLKGMLTAIGILLIFKQLPHLVGYDADFEGDESFFQKDGRNTFSEIEQALLHISPLAAIIGALGIGIQFLWDSKYFPFPKSKYLLPAPLFIVVMAIVMNRFLGVEDTHMDIRQAHMVNLPVIDSISQFPQLLTFPHFEYIKLKVVWIAALQ